MPTIQMTDIPASSMKYLQDKYDYTYPLGLDLRPDSELHQKLRDKILMRAYEASGAIKKRFSSWNEVDKVLSTYIALDEDEEDLKLDDSRKPVSIVFPYSYVILESILSYLLAAFFQEPVFRYEGVSPEDTLGAIMMEKKIDLDCNRNKVMLPLHTIYRDSLAYGFGVGAPGWDVVMGRKTVKQDDGFISALTQMFQKTGQSRKTVDATLFEGNDLTNIDPYLCLPDPNVAIHEVQKGEYFGWLDRTNYMKLLSDEKNIKGEYFNVKYVRAVTSKRSSIHAIDQSMREEKTGGPWKDVNTSLYTTGVDVIRMYVNLIPREWELGSGEYPEKWLFALAADDVVIQAKPLGLNHNSYPVAVAAPDFDGYSSSPVSRIEIINGLQGLLDFEMNTHVANIRKALNDMFVVDPYLINVNDVKKPGPGKIIRTRRPAWGRGVKDAIMQLGVNDVTRGNIADAGFISQLMQKVGGADDPLVGSLRQGGPERLTGQEFQGTQQGMFSRLQRVARIIGLQCMQDIGYQFASNTQQLMSEEVYVNTTGRWQETLMQEYADSVQKGKMKVTPYDVLVEYDLMVRDGSVPGSNFSQFWVEIFKIGLQNPEAATGMGLDMGKLFKYVGRNLGAKNVDEFVKVRVMPDEQVGQQQDRGNIVSMDQAIAGGAV